MTILKRAEYLFNKLFTNETRGPSVFTNFNQCDQ